MQITPGQIRAARRLAGITQPELVAATGLSLSTVKRAESERDVAVSEEAIKVIRAALEEVGVVFLPAGRDGGLGVKLRGGGS